MDGIDETRVMFTPNINHFDGLVESVFCFGKAQVYKSTLDNEER